MRLREFEEAKVEVPRLIALAQFLIGRAEDTGASKKISTEAFLNLAHDMGIGISRDNLVNLASEGKLGEVIVNVTPQEVIFKGAEDITSAATAAPDQNQAIVKSMAKRAIDIG
jgi:hypothetical protein